MKIFDNQQEWVETIKELLDAHDRIHMLPKFDQANKREALQKNALLIFEMMFKGKQWWGPHLTDIIAEKYNEFYSYGIYMDDEQWLKSISRFCI